MKADRLRAVTPAVTLRHPGPLPLTAGLSGPQHFLPAAGEGCLPALFPGRQSPGFGEGGRLCAHCSSPEAVPGAFSCGTRVRACTAVRATAAAASQRGSLHCSPRFSSLPLLRLLSQPSPRVPSGSVPTAQRAIHVHTTPVGSDRCPETSLLLLSPL